MKLLPVLTVGAVGSMIVAVGLVPAHAHDAETNLSARVTVSPDSDATETNEPDDPETDPAEERETEEAVVSESPTPDPSIEEEVEDAPVVETPVESEASVPDAPLTPRDETPLVEPIELPPSAAIDEATVEALSLLSEEPAAQAVLPSVRESAPASALAQVQESGGNANATVPQESATQAVLPSVQNSARATVLPPVRNSAANPVVLPFQGTAVDTSVPLVFNTVTEAGISRIIAARAGMAILPTDDGIVQAAPQETDDIPPTPRIVDTLKIPQDTNPPASDDTQAGLPEGQTAVEPEPSGDDEIESAEKPGYEALIETGAASAVLAVGGVLFLAAGVTLMVMRRRLSEPRPAARRRKRH